MEAKCELWKKAVSSMLVAAIVFCSPLESIAQSAVGRGNVLESNTQLVLRVDETFKADSSADTGTIQATVDADVYSADGSRVLIKSGTPAYMEYTADLNGSWGKAGRICLTHATTKTVDNKNVSLRLSSCKKRRQQTWRRNRAVCPAFPVRAFQRVHERQYADNSARSHIQCACDAGCGSRTIAYNTTLNEHVA